jgi:uncharacterized protein YlxW (UPF0749 family)
MNLTRILNDLLNPWASKLRRAELEVATLRREQALLVEELRKAQRELTPLQAHNKKLLDDLAKAQKNDTRGKDGKFKKGGSK